MNHKLKFLYSSKWKALIETAKANAINAANPLLVKVDQSYVDADVRVMIVGQETDGWYGCLRSRDLCVEELMDCYHNYFSQRNSGGNDMGKRAFWNMKNFKYFETHLVEHLKDKKVAFIWNNISKIGNDGRGKPSSSITELERGYFNIFLEEFEILKPDIVIFTTGESRDCYIKHHFGDDVIFTPQLSLSCGSLADKTNNLISHVTLPGFSAVKALRIEHPNRRTLDNSVTLHVLKQLIEQET
ncbi:hypothetical protein [Vibrio fluvialis]|uniref:hypothetical protein n=1 Tax=Vibrio fluvialis TaxID=676 RepID=UPI002B25E03E|nr:hypothetical protein [Vibrio fluvialis]WPK55458.1 hypothetical protein NAF16_17390 [Vibrio fluvialis]